MKPKHTDEHGYYLKTLADPTASAADIKAARADMLAAQRRRYAAAGDRVKLRAVCRELEALTPAKPPSLPPRRRTGLLW